MHCATSTKVTGLIPDGVISIFHLLNHSGSNVAPGSIQPLNTNEYPASFLVGKGDRFIGLKVRNHHVSIIEKFWEPQAPAALRACAGL